MDRRLGLDPASLRRTQAAGNKARREKDKRIKDLQRGLERTVKRTKSVVEQVARFETKLTQKPLGLINCAFSTLSGFSYDSEFKFSNGGFEVRLRHESEDGLAGSFGPLIFNCGTTTITSVAFLPTMWFTLFGFEIANIDPQWRLKCNWIRKGDPASSNLYLLDPIHDLYYYPIDSTLRGEVVAGHPKSALVAFEKIAVPTDRLEIHFSGVKLTSARGSSETFLINYIDCNLRHKLEAIATEQSLEQQAQSRATGLVTSRRESVKKLKPVVWFCWLFHYWLH